MATTDRLLYISSDGLVRQLGFDPTAADLGGAAGVASSTHSATSKTTPVDADELPIVDSADSWSLKKLTWANLKATLKTYFDTLYLGISATAANASQLLGFTWASPGPIGSTAPNSGAFTTLSATGNATLGDAEATDTHAIKGATTILANSASPALKVTQTGAGYAFVVEDVASDTTPFLIDGSGRVILGNPNTITGSQLEIHGITDAFKFSADAAGQFLRFFKGRGTAAAPWTTIVASGDTIGSLDYYGADGTGPILAARITASVDGTPGTNDMPGRLVFSTTADGANVPTERMLIDSSGNVGLGISPSSRLDIGSTSATVVDFKLRNSLNTAVTYVNSDGSVVINGINAYPMLFATSGVERMRIDSSGNVGIGVAPATKLDCFNSGTADTIAQVRNGTTSVQIQAGNGYSYINTYTAHPMLFGVGNVERMRIDSGGNVLVMGAAGLGYGTGAGGTVTQATSRTTGVTLNKPTGAITLVSAAGSTSWQSFTVTNSLVAATDVVCVVQKSGTDKYRMHVTNVAAGSFQITFATTGGTTTEQPVFNVAVIKGATS